MSQKKKWIVVVFCYGLCLQEARLQSEFAGLQQYFESCAWRISKLYKTNRLSAVVLTGGFTRPDFPEDSEARTSLVELRELLAGMGVPVDEIIFHLEENSYNTPQNLWYSCCVVRNGMFGDLDELYHNILFICDKARKPKVILLVLLYIRRAFRRMRFKINSYKRSDPHPNSVPWKQFLLSVKYCIPYFFKKERDYSPYCTKHDLS